MLITAPPRSLNQPPTHLSFHFLPLIGLLAFLHLYSHIFTMSSNTRLLSNSPQDDERPRKPYNIYYSIPCYKPFFYSYIFVGSFTFAWITDYLPKVGQMCLWAGFAITCGLLIAIHPSIYTERIRSDEMGKSVRVRRPLIGFKRCEIPLDVEGIDKGLYDAADGNTDSRLHDGCRYGYARIRI